MIGMVLADLYTAISGIGYLIVRTASTFQVDRMFVPIVTLGLLGVTLTALLRFVETQVAPWTKAGRKTSAVSCSPGTSPRRQRIFPVPGRTVAGAGGGIPLMFQANQRHPAN